MSFKLPAVDSPVRELFDVADLATLGTAEGRANLAAFRQALHGARSFLAREPGAKAVHVLCVRADGSLWLVRVTPKAWAKVWNFGKV